MSGMRTHMEIAGCMLATYKTELAFMPGLSELLQDCSDAYIYGAAYPDWTHATEYAQTAKGVVDEIQAVAGDIVPIPLVGAVVSILELAFHDILDVLNNPPPLMSDEMEHWRPYLKRLSLLLRQEAPDGQPTGDVARRVAYFLGISCHQAEDNAFHFRGEIGATPELGWLATRSLNPADTLPRFHVFGMQDEAILAYEQETGRTGDHGGVEQQGDWFYSAYPIYVLDAGGVVSRTGNLSIEPDAAAIYAELGRTPTVSTDDISRGRQFIDLWLRTLTSTLLIPPILQPIFGLSMPLAKVVLRFTLPATYEAEERNDNKSRSTFDIAVAEYFQGGVKNGAAAALMNALHWYAHFRGWYYFQNEYRAAYLDSVTKQSGPNNQEERGYIAYSGSTDISIAAPGAETIITGGDAQVASGSADPPQASLLRFELADNVDETRNVPRDAKIRAATLRLFCSATADAGKSADTRIEIYRINTPWAWGGFPEPGSSSTTPSSIIGTAGASWAYRNEPAFVAQDFTAESLAAFVKKVEQCSIDLAADLRTVADKIAAGPSANDTDYYDNLSGFAGDRYLAWTDRMNGLVGGVIGGTSPALVPNAAVSSVTTLITLLGDVTDRVVWVWNDAKTVLEHDDRTNAMLNGLAARLMWGDNPIIPDYQQWFSDFTKLLQATPYARSVWQQPGCNAVPGDRDGQPVTVFTVPAGASQGEWVAIDLTALVQSWVATPEHNCGMLLRAAAASANNGVTVTYTSTYQGVAVTDITEGTEIAHRPMLIIEV
jgi:hypothetical protein